MKQHKETFEQGYIVYRHPNCVEKMRMMGELGLSSNEDKMQSFNEKSEFLMIAKIMECLHDYKMVTKIEMKVGEKTINSWGAAIEYPEFMAPLTTVASKVLASLGLSKSEDAETPEGNVENP